MTTPPYSVEPPGGAGANIGAGSSEPKATQLWVLMPLADVDAPPSTI